MLDLQKLILRRLLDTKNLDLYSRLVPEFFTGANLLIYNKIQNYYRLNLTIPSIEEFTVIKKDIEVQDYLESEILSEDNEHDAIANEFILSQMQDYYIRESTINFLTKFTDDLVDLEKGEIIDTLQEHIFSLNKALPTNDELFDIGDMPFFPSEDDFVILPSGLSDEYDAINGGLALQEAVFLGGRRGSGKSIISLNMAIKRFLEGHTVAFFSIEMRYSEVYSRFISALSGVNFLDIFKRKLTSAQKIQIIKAKLDHIYVMNEGTTAAFDELIRGGNIELFEQKFKQVKEFKPNRFFLIDDVTLSLNRIEHYCNLFSGKYPKYTMGVVDYINIINIKDNKDWKSQITLSDGLKLIARKYNITVVTPYQIDKDGEARFAKGILDSADRAFIFMPPKEGEDQNIIKIFTSKIRNGKNITFDVGMDWECVRIDSKRSKVINGEKLLPGAQYGNEGEPGQKQYGGTNRDL